MTIEGYHEGYVEKNQLSGRYKYHSTKDNADIFVREGPVLGLVGKRFYLIYRNGCWIITNEFYAHDGTLSYKTCGFVRLLTKGNFKTI